MTRTGFEWESIWLEQYNAIYIEIPKVACSSIKTEIARLLDISLETADGDPHQVEYPSPGQPQSSDGTFYPGVFTFGFVRNPWDRLVSCYRDKIRGEVDGYTCFTIRPGVADCLARFDAFVAGMPFDEFVIAVASIGDEDADSHFRSQYTFLTNVRGELAVDFVGRYENLSSDFQSVQQTVAMPAVELPRVQVARPANRYVEYYTAATRSLVGNRFHKDIELFGYEFDAS
jgi:chondroitin 4-sulfotransferase 11